MNQGLADRQRDKDLSLSRHPFRIPGQHSEVIAIAHGRDGDASVPRPRRNPGQGFDGNHRSQAVVAVDLIERRVGPGPSSSGVRIAHTVADSLDHARQPQQAMRRDSAQLGLEQQRQLDMRVFLGHTGVAQRRVTFPEDFIDGEHGNAP